MRRRLGWVFGTLFLTVGLATWGGRNVDAWQDDKGPDPTEDVQVQTRGPIHEAFAEPVVFNPEPGIVVPKKPPAAIEELPPDQKPEGNNVEWIGGYWSWDDERKDFLWISGIWRDIPPGRQWVPGYWTEVEGGYQWVSGFWAPVQTEDPTDGSAPDADGSIEYLPTPPQSLEVGPNTEQPSQNHTWTPGYWYYRQSRYVWRPGTWVQYQPNWVWQPAHYVWTPRGCVFVQGFWDYAPAYRGLVFAPVYFQQPIYTRPAFVFTPGISLVTNNLSLHFFARPRYRHYYFGDYYAQNYLGAGIFPGYTFLSSRTVYDPFLNYYACSNQVGLNIFIGRSRDRYNHFRDNVGDRPGRVFVGANSVANINSGNTNVVNVTKNTVINKNTTVINNINNVTVNKNTVLAAPLNQVVNNKESNVKFVKVDDSRRKEAVQRTRDLQKYRIERARIENSVTPTNFERPKAADPGVGAGVGIGTNLGTGDLPKRVPGKADRPEFPKGKGANVAEQALRPGRVKLPNSPVAARPNRPRPADGKAAVANPTPPPPAVTPLPAGPGNRGGAGAGSTNPGPTPPPPVNVVNPRPRPEQTKPGRPQAKGEQRPRPDPDQPKNKQARPELPKADRQRPELPKADRPRPEIPKADRPKAQQPKIEQPLRPRPQPQPQPQPQPPPQQGPRPAPERPRDVPKNAPRPIANPNPQPQPAPTRPIPQPTRVQPQPQPQPQPRPQPQPQPQPQPPRQVRNQQQPSIPAQPRVVVAQPRPQPPPSNFRPAAPPSAPPASSAPRPAPQPSGNGGGRRSEERRRGRD